MTRWRCTIGLAFLATGAAVLVGGCALDEGSLDSRDADVEVGGSISFGGGYVSGPAGSRTFAGTGCEIEVSAGPLTFGGCGRLSERVSE